MSKKDQHARQHHSRSEVNEAMERMKIKYPEALFTMEHMALIACGNSDEKSEGEESISLSDDDEDENNFIAEGHDIFKAEEEKLENFAFIHGSPWFGENKINFNTLLSHVPKRNDQVF